MMRCRFLFPLLLLAGITIAVSGCVIGRLLYKDWHSKTAYRSSASKKDYFIIEGVTQSHCGCSDLVARHYVNKKPAFTFYYGGGLFPARKYIYQYDKATGKKDTLVYEPTTADNFIIPFDSLDRAILRQIDTLIATRPAGSGIIYKVERKEYKGFQIAID